MSLLPLGEPAGAATSAVAGLAVDRFRQLPNGRPSDPEDLLAILLLCTLDIDLDAPDPKVVAAKVQMAKLGFGHQLGLSETERLGLNLLAAWRFDRQSPSSIRRVLDKQHGVDQRLLVRSLWKRCLDLWARIELDRATMRQRCDVLADELASHLPDGLALRTHQLEGVLRARERRFRFLFADDMGLGKLQPDDAPVLTPSGWRPIADLEVGDPIIDPDGGRAVVQGVFPHGIKSQFKVTFGDGTWTECGEEHLWHVYTPNDRTRGRPGRVMTLRQMMDIGIKKKVICRGETQYQKRWFVPLTEPVEFAPHPDPMLLPPYLMGVLLGDGGLTHQVGLTNSDDHVVNRVREELPLSCRLVRSDPKKPNHFGIRGPEGGTRNQVLDELRQLGLFGKKSVEKFIPPQYLRASVEDRTELLHGLMDTDGDCSKGGVAMFNTSSPHLRDAVLDLVRGLGGIATLGTKKKPKYTYKGERRTGKPAYRVNVRLSFNPFTLPRKAELWRKPYMAKGIDSVEYSREASCRCIKVSSRRSLYVTNDYIVTHNTIEMLTCALLLGDDAFPMLVCSPLSMVGKWKSEALKWMSRRDIVVRNLGRDAGPKKLLDETRGRRLVMTGTWSQLVAHEGEIRDAKPGLFIGDESHYICGWESKRTQAAIRCRSSFGSVLLGTGTLMPNGRHIEAYPQLKMVAPNLFARFKPERQFEEGLPRGDRPGFMKHFCGPQTLFLGKDDKGNVRKATSYKGRSNEVEFGHLIAGVMIRRTKSEVFGDDGLPPKTRYAIPVEISDAQRMRLARARDQIKAKIQKRAIQIEKELIAEGLPDDAIEQRVKRTLSSEAVTLMSELRIKLGLIKADWSKQRVKELVSEGHRPVVFGWHDQVIRKAAAHYEKLGLSVLLGTGGTTGRQRDRIVAEAEKGTHDVVVLSSAYREGITLITYNRLIMLERWWIPGHEMQAEDRIHRMGQLRDVAIEYPLIPNSYDDAVGELQVWKEQGQHQAQGSAQERAYQWLMAS